MVILNTIDYDKECKRLLDDRNNYTPLVTDPSTELRIWIKNLVKEAEDNGYITKHEADFLTVGENVIAYFYTLPKTHKNRTPPPGRPIVSGIGSLLEPLSQFCDFFLKPLIQQTPTYLKDTKSLLSLLQDLTIDDDSTILVTLDIESLYTSIPQDDTIRVLGKLWKRLPGTTRLRRNLFWNVPRWHLNTISSNTKATCSYNQWGLRWAVLLPLVWRASMCMISNGNTSCL